MKNRKRNTHCELYVMAKLKKLNIILNFIHNNHHHHNLQFYSIPNRMVIVE